MAYQTPQNIYKVVKDISENKYVLPAIQREFVWDTRQIECFFDSIMREYPIGTFLLWELNKENKENYEFYSFMNSYNQKNCRHNSPINLAGTENILAVLDGQQRLTALYIGLKGTYAFKTRYKSWKNDNAFPKRTLFLDLLGPAPEASRNYYNFLFLTEEDTKQDEHHYWFPVGRILSMEFSDVTDFIIDEIAPSGYTKEQITFARKTISQLFNVIHNKDIINTYIEESTELDKVLNIFIRINSGGTTLSYSDLLLSIASAQWENCDARQEIIELVDSINHIGSGFDINKDFVLKSSLVLSDLKDIAFKVDNFTKSNMQIIENKWPVIKKSLYASYVLLNSLGFSRENLSSNNAVIPIAYYLMMLGLPANFEQSFVYTENRKIIKKWLIISLLKKIFSGQPDNILRPLRDIIKENDKNDFPLDKIISRFRGTQKSFVFTDDEIENILERKYDKSNTSSVLMLLYQYLNYNNKIHVDHIYPRSKFTKKYLLNNGVKEDDVKYYIEHVNDISNLQMLEAIPNMEKQNKDFSVWFKETNSSNTEAIHYRTMHYLPDMDYSYANFKEFLKERRNLLKQKLTEILV